MYSDVKLYPTKRLSEPGYESTCSAPDRKEDWSDVTLLQKSPEIDSRIPIILLLRETKGGERFRPISDRFGRWLSIPMPFKWAFFRIFVAFFIHMFEFLNLSFHFSPPKSFYFFIKNFFEVLIDVIVLGEIFSLVIQKQSSRQKLHFGDTRSRKYFKYWQEVLIRKVFLKSVPEYFHLCVAEWHFFVTLWFHTRL